MAGVIRAGVNGAGVKKGPAEKGPIRYLHRLTVLGLEGRHRGRMILKGLLGA